MYYILLIKSFFFISSNSTDAGFDAVIGHIEEIVMGTITSKELY